MKIGGGTDNIESFNNFFQCWLVEQDQFLNELLDVSKHYETNNNNNTPTTGSTSIGDHQVSKDQVLRSLIDKAIDHYEKYYRAKSRSAKEDVLAMFSPCWMSKLEEAFLWIGGWRPSMAFHLLYSKSGSQFEARLSELLRGISTGDLGDLSPNQVVRVDELQMKTIREERQVTEKMAKLQETVGDSSMVELSHKVTELIRSGDRMSEEEDEDEDEQVESNLASKEEGFGEMLDEADDLRLRTLIEVISILKPMQAVHFLIAAWELHLRVHDWGKKRDARNQNHGGGDGVNLPQS
ncbi:hypothetical protein LWI28_028756 [Acer negundo]|uniref:DOG1 domain-containing protein n=1 Tax=Acer negundo TaxID=4023 RepID=A0AAD5NKX8_ACENE|nr:hypothetical protein LWI28_028756 [Acer negundo]KAK4841125.1 hypothetical protein QYF36_026449 [Acer negundo]